LGRGAKKAKFFARYYSGAGGQKKQGLHNAGLVEPPDLVVRLRGVDPIAPPHWPLPIEKARFVGEGVAMVVAESIAAAKDMAERVDIDYEPLPAVNRAVEAIKPGAPVLWDEAPDNLCIDIEAGDAATTSTAFARAAHIVRLDTWVQRVTGVPLEAPHRHCKVRALQILFGLYLRHRLREDGFQPARGQPHGTRMDERDQH
jgi:CO/xanthine dehydrogenase Mo-binding subunit